MQETDSSGELFGLLLERMFGVNWEVKIEKRRCVGCENGEPSMVSVELFYCGRSVLAAGTGYSIEAASKDVVQQALANYRLDVEELWIGRGDCQ